MGGCCIGVKDVSSVGVDVGGLCVAFFRSGGKDVEGVSNSVCEVDSAPLIEDVQGLSLVPHTLIFRCLFIVNLYWFRSL
jgi:hypothetical protein